MDPKSVHSIIWHEISQRFKWMLIKSILKIWLLSVDFEKFTSMNLWGTNHSTSNALLWLVSPYVHRGEFLKDNGHQSNFQYCLCLHSLPPLWNFISNYRVPIFDPYDFLEMNYITIYSMIPQRSHNSPTLQGTRFRDSTTVTLTPGDDTTAIKVGSSA